MTSHLAWVDCDRGDWEQNLRNPVKCPLLHQLSSIPSKLLVISIADRFLFFPARENLLQEEKSHVGTFSNPEFSILQKVDESVRVTLVTNPNVVKALITQTVRTTEYGYVLYICKLQSTYCLKHFCLRQIPSFLTYRRTCSLAPLPSKARTEWHRGRSSSGHGDTFLIMIVMHRINLSLTGPTARDLVNRFASQCASLM